MPEAEAPGGSGTSLPPEARLAPEIALEASLVDLTARFRQMKQLVYHLQRMASLGTSAAVFAHEYNNLITPAINYARKGLELDDPDLLRKAAETIVRSADALTSMAERILGMARRTAPKREPVGLRRLVEEAVATLGRDLGKDRIQLSLDIDPSLKVMGDPGSLHQVLFNLISNARQAMLPGGGRLTIRARRDAGTPGFVRIEVADTGCGIRPEDLERIFEPFFSRRDREAGTGQGGVGLGLYVSREIVRDHGGNLSASSSPGEGTTFVCLLPIAEQG